MTADIHTLAGPYALDALPDDERRLFEEHLDACAGCRQEVAELQATAARLGAAVSTQPPASLKDRVLTQVGKTRQARVPTPLRRRPVSWRRMLAPVAAALGVIVVALGFAVAQLNQRVTAVEATAAQTRQVLTASDTEIVTLDAPSGVSAGFAYSPDLGQGVFVAEGLAPVDRSEIYELWTITAQGATPAGTFLPDTEGGTSQLVIGDLGEVDALGVTVEPVGGSEQPTGEILIFGEL